MQLHMQGIHAGECEEVIAVITDHDWKQLALYLVHRLSWACPLPDQASASHQPKQSFASRLPASLWCWCEQCEKHPKPEMQAFLATVLVQ